MNKRLWLRCHWFLDVSPGDTYKPTVCVITPGSLCNKPWDVSSNALHVWRLKSLPDIVQNWFISTHQAMRGPSGATWLHGDTWFSKYGRALWVPCGVDNVLTLPALVSTWKGRVETAFLGCKIFPGDNIIAGAGVRVFLPDQLTYLEDVKRCFANRTESNSLCIDYANSYRLSNGIPAHDCPPVDAQSV